MQNFVVPVKLVRYQEDGAIAPNPLFHRAWNKLHSRCIEYPFAAAQITPDADILDLGSDKAEDIWLTFLSSIPGGKIRFFDYEQTQRKDLNIIRGDCRSMPFADNSFDIVCAISLIEHIGLERAQVVGANQPLPSSEGDLEALTECARVLKPEGKLIMTVPMGVKRGFFSGGTARVYVKDDIDRFSTVLKPVILDYYEYRLQKGDKFFPIGKVNDFGARGLATWQRIPLDQAQAKNDVTIDGVLTSVWKKQ